jgi:transcriptional regulator with XRE-family HTH domain
MRIFNLTELGAAIRSARSTKGLSQSDLAEAIDATQEWVSRLENGRLPNPGLATVMHACSTIDLAIFVGIEESSPDRDVPAAEASGDLALGTPGFLKRL